MQDIEMASPARKAVLYGLAATGFVALVALGIWFAIYSSRYVPKVVSRLGAAAVTFSEVFKRENPGLVVVSTSTPPSTISFGDATSTPSTSTPPSGTGSSAGAGGRTPGQQTSTSSPIGGTRPSGLYGHGDLTVSIDTMGYLTGPSTDTFVASSTVPAGHRGAVRFTVTNRGTNVMPGGWRFSATIPTQTYYTFQSPAQAQALNPGDSIQYTLGFDQPTVGVNQSVTILVNPDRNVSEGSFNNNSATGAITVRGS